MEYNEFLATKRRVYAGSGIDAGELPGQLFDWQSAVVRWALKKGRAAIWGDCGLGKTPMQLAWADQATKHAGKPVLILAPLAVSHQTRREGEKFGIPVTVCATGSDVRDGVNVTNYEKLHHFSPDDFCGLVCDESSILKSFGGEVRKQITSFGLTLPYRLACTATPAPNDLIEITNHAEFLGVLSGKEIIALFFRQDGNTTHAWRLKAHAHKPFYEWLASWAVAIRRPSDLGYPNGAFVLPELRMHQVTLDDVSGLQTRLFASDSLTLEERRTARRGSLPSRVRVAADMVNASTEPWIVWCNLNAESVALAKAIPDAVEVTGSDPEELKESRLAAFLEGRARVLVTKPAIAGFGLNLQHCAHVAFVGLSDSWEQYYQAIRRCWRFGQTRPVECYVITSETEGAVVRNIQRKDLQAATMMDELVKEMRVFEEIAQPSATADAPLVESVARGDGWELHTGDCVETMDRIPSESVGLCIFSPPFPGMYAYSNSSRDIGNTSNIAEMIEHFRFVVGRDKLWRLMMPGRMACIHLMQLTAMKSREGYVGLHDYRGAVIQMMIDEGWVYAGEVTIDKNPQVQAVRNKERGLLFKTLANDSSLMRMALADYLIYFRKPGDNPVPIHAGISPRYNPNGGWITEQEWIEWAAPVWYRQKAGQSGGIMETDVLNAEAGKEQDDERHLCPLQLGVIERAVKLWSAPGDVVFSPFAGIGSEGYEAVRLNRRFVGIELKPSYAAQAARNLALAVHHKSQGTLFTAEAEQ